MEEHSDLEAELQVTSLVTINKALDIEDDVVAPVAELIDGECVNAASCTTSGLIKSEHSCGDTEKLEDPLNIVIPELITRGGGENKDNSTYNEIESYEAVTLVNEDISSVDWAADGMIAQQASETPDLGLQLSPDTVLTSPAAMSELLVASADTCSERSSEVMELEAYDKRPVPVEVGDDQHNEEDGHATITAVAEEAVKVTPLDEDMEDVLAKIRNKLACESIQVLESGEILALPKGWTTRRSKTNDGKMYFVSPYGHTQWLRPPMKTGVMYNWVHEIEVTFGPGRLGLNLKQIAGIPGTEFTDLQVHIAEIYKLPNGMASPAEIYNWSVKPEKRLAINMRVIAMSGISLTGYTYSEVLELLARVVRPVRIKFADVSKGIVGRVDEKALDEETEEGKEARAARLKQSSLRSEYFQILVSYELYRQVWAATRRRMHSTMLELLRKNEVMESRLGIQHQHHESLETEREYLAQETSSLKRMIEQLDLQLAGKIDSPEVLRTAELTQRSAMLEKEVTEIIAENDALQTARIEIEETLDTLQQELDAYGDLDADFNGNHEVKFFSPAFLGSMVHRGSIDTRAEDARERLLDKIVVQRNHLEEEIKLEEERAKFVESEINLFQNQMSVAAEAVKREDAFISGERPPQMIFLENKIAMLKKNLRETIAGIAKAAKCGDQQQADNLFIRRADLKDDLNTALDEMRRMEGEMNVYYDIDKGKQVEIHQSAISVDDVDIDEAPHERVSETSRLQSKLAKLQVHLHDTVNLLAKEKDEARKSDLSKRRLLLKSEMKAVQDQFQALTQGTLNVAVKSRDSDPRPSFASAPTIQEAPRRSTVGSRASLGNFRGIVSGARASMVSNVNKVPEISARDSERCDPNFGRRSGSSASMASLTHSYDSNSNQGPRDGSIPTMSGILRKHATYSNEKGAFGNMSIRGVRERWFNIEPDGYLRYYKREGDREPRGAIPLQHKSLEILHGKEVGKSNEFMLCSPTHQTRIVAKSHDEMLVWVKVLQLAHTYFMQQVCGSNDGGQDHVASAVSPDAELAYRNQRATLGF
ncbi:putative oxysterol-binding protein [Plasmopara halstedii]